MNEFALIDYYFKRRTQGREDVLLGVGDDAALLSVPAGQTLVASIDTSVSGVHFPVNTPASDIGYKSLAVSLSDMAAMGAEPAWVMLALTLPEENKSWLADFCEGFFALCDRYALQLVGGDTTRGSLSISTQVMGFVPLGQAVLRSGARAGDLIFVTGSLGAAGLGLMACRNLLNLTPLEEQSCLKRLNRPEARVAVGKALRSVASAMIDISDGVLADLEHVLKAGGVGATLKLQDLPLDETLKNNLPSEKAYSLALTAGDDYELCFTVPPERHEQLTDIFANLDCPCTCIGVIEKESGLRVLDEKGQVLQIETTGYRHFG